MASSICAYFIIIIRIYVLELYIQYIHTYMYIQYIHIIFIHIYRIVSTVVYYIYYKHMRIAHSTKDVPNKSTCCLSEHPAMPTLFSFWYAAVHLPNSPRFRIYPCRVKAETNIRHTPRSSCTKPLQKRSASRAQRTRCSLNKQELRSIFSTIPRNQSSQHRHGAGGGGAACTYNLYKCRVGRHEGKNKSAKQLKLCSEC